MCVRQWREFEFGKRKNWFSLFQFHMKILTQTKVYRLTTHSCTNNFRFGGSFGVFDFLFLFFLVFVFDFMYVFGKEIILPANSVSCIVCARVFHRRIFCAFCWSSQQIYFARLTFCKYFQPAFTIHSFVSVCFTLFFFVLWCVSAQYRRHSFGNQKSRFWRQNSLE